MILVANSAAAHRNNRRKTGNGWHTTYIGQNRNTLKEGDAEPADDIIYPMAFLVEKDPAAIVKPHYHQADQYQVVVQGGGRLGIHDVSSISVHYTGRYSAYGPIIAADEGISWFTLRNTWDPGARYMPAYRDKLRAARARWQHKEATCGPISVLSDADRMVLPRVKGCEVIQAEEDGLGTWHYSVPPGGSIVGPNPATGGGQFWLVAAGTIECGSEGSVGVNSCVFVSPDNEAATLTAGPEGADLICMQFPLLEAAA